LAEVEIQKDKDEKNQKALQFFRERYEAMDKARKTYYDQMEADEKLFRSHLEVSTKADWQSKYFIPRVYGLAMASLSEFAINKPDILVEPDTRSDAMRVPYMKAVMHANWRKNKGNAELLFALLDAIKLGIAIFEVGYRKDKRTIKDITDYDPATEESKWKKKDIYDFDDVYFEIVNPRYFWVDESSNTVKNATDCIRKYIYGEQAFHQVFDSKFPKAKTVQTKGEVIKDEFFKPFVGTGTGTNEICVYKYINKIKDVVWWIANGVLLNDPEDPIPFHHKQLPYAEVKIAPYDKYTFYGLSLPRIVQDIQHELNTLRNMAIDQTHLNIFSPFFYSADEDLDESIFTIEPGVGIPVSDPNAFQFFKQKQMGQDVYQMMDRFDEDSRQATGFDPRMQGLQTGGTATETTVLKETSLKRINLYLRFLEDFSMPDFAGLWGDVLQQFYFMSSNVKKKKVKDRRNGNEREEIFRSIKIPKSEISQFRTVEQVGEFNFLDVTSQDIRGVFDFNIKIGTTIAISKELTKQVKLQLYSILSAEELVKKEKLVVDLLKAHDLDPEEYMTVSQQTDVAQSIALAEEHNKQIIAGEKPRIMPELITPEHIQLHDALIKSKQLNKETRQRLVRHTMEEMRMAKAGLPSLTGATAGAPAQAYPALERTPELTKPLMKMPGLTKAAVSPATAAEISAKTLPTVTGSAVGRPTVRPR